MFSFATRGVWRREWTGAAIALAVFAWRGDASAGDVVVKVVDNKGSPVADAEVKLVPVEGGRDLRTSAGAAGRYVLLDVVPGRYRLKCGGPSSKEITVGISVDQQSCRR